MSLVRWNRPHGTLPVVFDEMDRMFDRFFRYPMIRALERESFEFGPAVDVYETDTELVVKAELPGIKKEDVDLTVEDGRLLMRGQSRHEEEVNEEGYHRRELRYGSFYRAVPLPAAVKEEEISASFDDGILTVRAPKAEETPKGKKVEIK